MSAFENQAMSKRSKQDQNYREFRIQIPKNWAISQKLSNFSKTEEIAESWVDCLKLSKLRKNWVLVQKLSKFLKTKKIYQKAEQNLEK